jgi:hypothetical protein
MAKVSFDDFIRLLSPPKATFSQENASIPDSEIQWARHIDGTSERSKQPIPIMALRKRDAAVSTRQQTIQQRRANPEAIRPFHNPVVHTTTRLRPQPLYTINEEQDFSYLSQSPDLTSASYASVTFSPALKWGELQTQGLSYTSTSSRSDFTWPMPYRVYPTTSDEGLTTVSIATRPARSCSIADDMLSGPIISHSNYSVASDSKTVDAYKFDDVAAQIFPQSSFSSPVVSQSQPSFLDNRSSVSFSSQTEMKRSPSEEKATSSLSLKQEYHSDSSSTEAKLPKIIDATGPIRHLAEKMQVNLGDSILQSPSQELLQSDVDMYSDSNLLDDAISYDYIKPIIPPNSANSYDRDIPQDSTDLVSEARQFTNSAGSVIDQSACLHRRIVPDERLHPEDGVSRSPSNFFENKPNRRVKASFLSFVKSRYNLTGPQQVDAVGVPPEILGAEEERVLRELLLGKECSVCGKPTTDARAVHGALTPSCTHEWSVVICTKDLQRYLATRMAPEDGRVSSSILCWAPNCNAILRHHDIQQHAKFQDFEAYDNALLRQAIHAGESFAECSTSGCRGGGWVDSISNISYFVCDLCYRATCIEHNGPYETHTGKPCPATASRRDQTERERKRREKVDKASEKLLKRTARLGPCGHWVSKTAGCDHMTCTCFPLLLFALSFLSPHPPKETI